MEGLQGFTAVVHWQSSERHFRSLPQKSQSLEARAERVAADAEVRINKLDLQILKLKQKEAKACAQKRSLSRAAANNVPIGSGPTPTGVLKS